MEAKDYSYKKLIVWKEADVLAFEVYQITQKFPKHELFGITSQLRRAVLSVPLNIVEGNGRQNSGERKQFVNIAMGSLTEVEYLLGFCHRLGYFSADILESLELKRKSVGFLLWRLYKSF